VAFDESPAGGRRPEPGALQQPAGVGKRNASWWAWGGRPAEIASGGDADGDNLEGDDRRGHLPVVEPSRQVDAVER
jgi:hypothetical protein